MAKCPGCTKGYSSKGNLSKHHRQSTVCQDWTKVNGHIYNLVQGGIFPNASDMLSFIRGDKSSLVCCYCSKSFANKGSLNKHLQSSIICDKWRQYNVLSNAARLVSEKEWQSCIRREPEGTPPCSDCDGDEVESNSQEVCIRSSSCAPFTPSSYQLCHVIWNIFLFDKEAAKKEDFRRICRDNNIEYVVGIFPDLSTLTDTISFDIEKGLLAYKSHDTTLSFDAFDKEISKIEELRSRRKNVAVVCNSGYQRSLPFLVHYLTKHHSEEVPTIAKAMDIILPQVDKENFAKTRDDLIDSITTLFSSNRA